MKFCPVVRMGKLCVEVTPTSKIAKISEILCIGCGICTKKCPFGAITIINLPKDMEKNTTHRYGPNTFKLHRMPVPRPGQVERASERERQTDRQREREGEREGGREKGREGGGGGERERQRETERENENYVLQNILHSYVTDGQRCIFYVLLPCAIVGESITLYIR